MIWRDSEEVYLKNINRSCLELSALYNAHYVYLKALSANFRLPAIVIGATASAISFGTGSFPFQFQPYISIVVGGTSLLIAIINTIESYLEISKTQNASFATLTSLKKISDDIVCELSLPLEDRETAGGLFSADHLHAVPAGVERGAPPRYERRAKKRHKGSSTGCI